MGVRTEYREALAKFDGEFRELLIAALEYIDASERHLVARSAAAEDRNEIAGEIYEAKKRFLHGLSTMPLFETEPAIDQS